MDLLNELARTDIDPALLAQVQALFAQQQAKLAEKDFKITALTHELAYYRRVRFGKASEALVGEQRLLFEETVDTDLAAIEEELESQAPAKRQRQRAGRQPLPPELPRIEHRHDPCKQARGGQAAINDGWRDRRGRHRLAWTAGVLRTDMAMHEEARRLHVQLLADVFADLDQVGAALTALARSWFVTVLDAR